MSTNSNEKTLSHLIGGFVGGLTSALVLQPFDLLKTRVQQTGTTTISECIKNINHPLELWRGSLPSCLRTSIGSGLYLSSLHLVRSTLAKTKQSTSKGSSSTALTNININKSSNLPKLSPQENLLSGAVTRAIVGLFTMPITVIKVRFESTLYNYKTINEAIRDINSKQGINGFFKGVGPTVARDAPYAGLYVLLYENCKTFLPNYILSSNNKVDITTGKFTTPVSTLINASSAIIAATLATTFTSPFDTIKTRMQLEPKLNKTFLSTTLNIIKNEHLSNLFDGLSLRLIRKSLSAGIAWGIYEELIKRFMA
ncbi:probable Solute carrier family 25 member 38 homolog [Saccharomycodes ludwigii]|uniref:Mitochondrial glycine transporter n=1 Tax=Saccharomycodes ludwigii TaxID=36035 RepID=A0A376B6L5_9ASCO|nr:hypothetical protein SCDLUD_002725 [Saccharomycodes ludwigii]KAH3901237.1 hypothetical protein SCDLUD_002725 [Saccharomycodes ludwigii]SSD60347.1 probable Solute carrier family 25 member 38 homolog [Saccharomycodes ludwigii]